jgi:hypothetical protein
MERSLEETPASLPRILRHCKQCHEVTPHAVHDGSLIVCLLCVERALNYELDRD